MVVSGNAELNGELIRLKAGESIDALKAVAFESGTGLVKKATYSNVNLLKIAGVSVESATTNQDFLVQVSGKVEGFSGLTKGKDV